MIYEIWTGSTAGQPLRTVESDLSEEQVKELLIARGELPVGGFVMEAE